MKLFYFGLSTLAFLFFALMPVHNPADKIMQVIMLLGLGFVLLVQVLDRD